MRGQWIGNFTGSNRGHVIVNIEKIDEGYDSQAFIFSENERMPTFEIDTILKLEGSSVSGTSYNVIPINPDNSVADKTLQFRDGTPISKSFNFEGTRIDEHIIELKWHGVTLKSYGDTKIQRSDPDERSIIDSKDMSWDQFKKYILEKSNRRDFVFRGQQEDWKLRTTFHRAGRCNLSRYLKQDVTELQRFFSANMNRLFKVEDSEELGALLSLAQHHGYPTPFLDWTESPFIAAYFAFEGISKLTTRDFVRIIVFDRKKWRKIEEPPGKISAVIPRVGFHDLLPIENKRMLPQQSVSLYSNFDDIERYIKDSERIYNFKCLEVIQISKTEKKQVIDELRYMGITAGALFPGLDGICKELREKNF